MIALILMVTFAAWCFAQAFDLHLRGQAKRARWLDPRDTLAPVADPEPKPSFAMPEVRSPRPVNPAREPLHESLLPDLDEDITADQDARTDFLSQELVVEIHRRELGGGEALACVVRWDGFRARWESVDLPADQVEDLQRTVLERSGLWPGHGRIYVEAVARALDDPWGRTRWRVERVTARGAA
jgi:hypothetical protein